MVILGRKILYQPFALFCAIATCLIIVSLGWYLTLIRLNSNSNLYLAAEEPMNNAAGYKLLNSGNLLYNNDKPEDAENAWRAGLSKKNDDEIYGRLLNNLGVNELKSEKENNDPKTAVNYLRDAAALNIPDSDREIVLGNLELALQKYLESLNNKDSGDISLAQLVQKLLAKENNVLSTVDSGETLTPEEIEQENQEKKELISQFLKSK